MEPILQQLQAVFRPAEIFEFHLLELAGSKGEIARIDFVAECFADLSDSEWELFPGNLQDIFKLNEDGLSRLRPEISDCRLIFGCAHIGLKHQVEGSRFSKIEAAAHRTLFPAILFWQLICSKAGFTIPTVYHRIGERILVSARDPDLPVHEDRAVHADDIVAFPHHAAPPEILQVPFQLSSERSVIPTAVQAAVDFARLEDKSPALAEADDLFHAIRAGLCLSHIGNPNNGMG